MTASSNLLVASVATLVLGAFAHSDYQVRGGTWRNRLRIGLFCATAILQCVGWSLKVGGF